MPEVVSFLMMSSSDFSITNTSHSGSLCNVWRSALLNAELRLERISELSAPEKRNHLCLQVAPLGLAFF